MKTKVVMLSEKTPDKSVIKEAGKVIKDGGLVAFPTETVYGLGANALDSEAVSKIFMAKGRPQDNPLIIHVGDYNIEPYVKNVPIVAREIIKKFWPGPITIILEKTELVPQVTSAKLPTVGIRMPQNNIAIGLIKAAGVPIAAPSANISGRPSPTDMESCVEDLEGKIDYILGMKYRHYAPKAPVKIVDGDIDKVVAKINEIVLNYIKQGKKVGIIATDETKSLYNKGTVISIGARCDIEDIGKNLFRVLRSFDSIDIDIILCEAFEESGVGTAVMNRLKKSAGFNILKV